MRFVCDALDGRAWFQIEAEGEAALESDLMNHAVEKHFRQAREHARMSYVPPSGSYIEQDIGLCCKVSFPSLWVPVSPWNPYTHFRTSPSKTELCNRARWSAPVCASRGRPGS